MKQFIILVLVGFSLTVQVWAADNSPAAIKAKEKLSSNTSSTQIPFIKNEGQIPTPEVKFYTKIFNGSVFITDKGEFVYSIITRKDYLGADECIDGNGELPGYGVYLKETPVIDEVRSGEFMVRNTPNSIEVTGLEPSPTVVNFFIGDKPENWRTNIQTYKIITMGEVWEGITINLKANQKNIEKLFIINPNGDVKSIRFSLGNIKELSLSNSGELEVITSLTSNLQPLTSFTRPIAYQEINGIRKNIGVSYRLIDKTTYGFTVGNYDQSIPLVIDPILSSTYIGGSLSDSGQSIAVDSNGNIFIAGYSGSADYPVAGEEGLPPYNPTWTIAGTDIVVSKFDPTLSVLLASTFVGGPSSDGGLCIAIDTTVDSNVFVAGYAGAGFPTATDKLNASPFDNSYNGPQQLGLSSIPEDACVIKLNNSLTRLLASTYVGGYTYSAVNYERAYDIAIDSPDNNIFICGETNNYIFPTNGVYRNNFGGQDAFLVKLNNNLSGYTPSDPSAFYFSGTFLGGTPVPFQGLPGNEVANGIAIDSENNVFITGFTSQGSPDFPTTNGAYLIRRPATGGQDAFVSKFNNNISTLIASTFLGGTGGEVATDIIIGRQGGNTPYICGVTASTDFTVTINAYNSAITPGLGAQDSFVSRFNNTLTNLTNSTWIGGAQSDAANSICQSSINTDIYICGSTDSADYPTSYGSFGTINNGYTDVCISVFNETLSTLNASTYIGGTANESANCIRTDKSGNILITGYTDSGNPPLDVGYPVWPLSGTDTAFDISFNYNPAIGLANDIFVTIITNDLFGGYTQPPPTVENPVITSTGSSGDPFAPANTFTKPLGKCFIATAVYGSSTHPNVMVLKNFRDKYLLTNSLGSKFVNWYYKVSPKIADYLKTSPFKASIVRLTLTPLVYAIKYPTVVWGLVFGGLLLLIWNIKYQKANPPERPSGRAGIKRK
ncbi:MAG: CFI-box-CTERM domain-containing protein [Planctomycetota bacterium]